MRLDLHVHSMHSRDGRGTVLELAHAAKIAGLDGFALTDHDTTAGHAHIQAAEEATGLFIIPGCEVTTAEGHILALGIERAPPKGEGVKETVQHILEQGGIAIAAHPYRLLTGIGPTGLDERRHLLAAAEARNARDRRMVMENLERRCEALGYPMTGGSDAHIVTDIGTAWTEVEAASVREALDAIEKGACSAHGRPHERRVIWRHRMHLAQQVLGRSR